MNRKHLGRQSVRFDFPPSILSYASVVGKKEGEGPLAAYFDQISTDTHFGQTTWEKAEALINVAHPDFREELIKEAEKMHIWRRSNKI